MIFMAKYIEIESVKSEIKIWKWYRVVAVNGNGDSDISNETYIMLLPNGMNFRQDNILGMTFIPCD